MEEGDADFLAEPVVDVPNGARPGARIGPYRLDRMIGEGGMGVVYRAHQPSLERTVAIKLLSSDLIGDPDGVRRFRQEARAIARLNHPNIVQVYDIEEEENLLKPVVSRLREEGIPLEPPAPNDTLFYRLRNAPKAVIVSFSHDLGLTPFKLLYFDKGVNLSLGLPVVRTSPDHGTAFDLAGKGVASEGSLVRALRLARSLQRRRALG